MFKRSGNYAVKFFENLWLYAVWFRGIFLVTNCLARLSKNYALDRIDLNDSVHARDVSTLLYCISQLLHRCYFRTS